MGCHEVFQLIVSDENIIKARGPRAIIEPIEDVFLASKLSGDSDG